MNKLVIALLSTLLAASLNAQTTAFNDIDIINSLFGNIINSSYCIKISEPISAEVFNNDSVQYQNFLKTTVTSQNELDTLEKNIILSSDSLNDLDISNHRKLLKRQLQNKPLYRKLIRKYENKLKGCPILPDSMKMNGVQVLTNKFAVENSYSLTFGKTGNKLNLGFATFSRIYYDEKLNSGFFQFTYLGGPECGYNGYIFFSKDKENWKYEFTCYTGVF